MFPFPMTFFSSSGGVTGNIASIQTISITIPTSNTSATAAITSVDILKSVIFFGGATTDDTGSAANTVLPRIELTNGTTVTAYRNSSSASSTVTVRATVVEFTTNMVESVEAGTITLSSSQTSNTASITSVDTSRSAVFFLGNTSDYSLNLTNTVLAAVELTNGTTVTAMRNSINSSTMVVGYAVVQFRAAVINSVQKRAVALTTSNTSDNDMITSVNTSNTILLHNGCITGGTTYSNSHSHVRLTGSTTVAITRNGTSTGSRSVYYTVLEFVSGVLNSIQRNASSITSGNNSTDSTISSVNAAKSICSSCGFLVSGTTYNNQLASSKLLNATTVRNERGGTSNSATASWEVIEFV